MKSPGGEGLPEEVEQCIRSAGRDDARDARDILARRCGDGGDWTEVLPRLVPPPMGIGYHVIDPEEFSLVAKGQLSPPDNPILVNGNISLSGSTLRKVPRAVIRGCVEVADCGLVEELDFTCTGWLAITNCGSLSKVRGEVFGSVTIKSCPVARIGADFRVAGSLFIQMCRAMGRLNCEIGGGLEARGCGVIKTGPAFSAHTHALVDGCSGFLGGGGVVAGIVLEGMDEGSGRVYIDRGGKIRGGKSVCGLSLGSGVTHHRSSANLSSRRERAAVA